MIISINRISHAHQTKTGDSRLSENAKYKASQHKSHGHSTKHIQYTTHRTKLNQADMVLVYKEYQTAIVKAKNTTHAKQTRIIKREEKFYQTEK